MKTKTIKSGIHHTVDITSDRSGRMSIVVYADFKKVIDVELPPKTGEFKDVFKPCVRIFGKDVEIEDKRS